VAKTLEQSKYDYLVKNKITNLANLTNLATDAKDVLSATNVGYVNQARTYDYEANW